MIDQPFLSSKSILPAERLIFALDVPSPTIARQLVETLGDAVSFYKIGLELFMAGGYFELIEWLRARDRRSGRIPIGKFNPGQKLNAAFTLGSIIVMLLTGTMMFFSSYLDDALRTGATFVHDWLSLAILVVVVGHTYMAFNDASARAGMRTGSVPVRWAKREHPAWAAELLPPAIDDAVVADAAVADADASGAGSDTSHPVDTV